VHDNAGPNIFYEISLNAKIDHNRIWNQSGDFWPALYVASSGSVEVSDNVVAWSGRGMQAYAQARADAPLGAGTRIFFHDNTVLMARDGFAAFWGRFGNRRHFESELERPRKFRQVLVSRCRKWSATVSVGAQFADEYDQLCPDTGRTASAVPERG